MDLWAEIFVIVLMLFIVGQLVTIYGQLDSIKKMFATIIRDMIIQGPDGPNVH